MAKAKKKNNKKEDNNFIDEIKKSLGNREIITVDDFLSTGSTLLDYIISNRRDGGIPVGRITEICGNEASGKSLLAYHIMANTQRRDGLAVYIDTERAVDKNFMKRMGVETEKNFIYPEPMPKSIEEVFDYIEKVVKVTRSRFPNKEKLVTVVWDSVAATQAHASIESDYLKGGEGITPEARAMSRCFKKVIDALDLGYVTLVCINQLRKNIGVVFGDDEITPHGKALPFYASCRIKLRAGKKIKEKATSSRIIGVSCRPKIIKNKVAPGWRETEFPMMFDWGVDDQASWIDLLKELNYVKTSGAWSSLDIGGHSLKFQGVSGWKKMLRENPDVVKDILNVLEENMIIKFDQPPESFIVDPDSLMEKS